MMMIFDDVRRILLAPASTLAGLAKIVDQTPEELFQGESFDGVDLQDEPVELLLRIDANFDGAILTRAQTNALRDGKGVQAARLKNIKIEQNTANLKDSIKQYVENVFPTELHESAMSALWSPLQPHVSDRLIWKRDVLPYVARSLRYIAKNAKVLKRETKEALLKFMLKMKAIRMPLTHDVVSALTENDIVIVSSTMQQIIDIDQCTAKFVYDWLAHLAPADEGSPAESGYGTAYGETYGEKSRAEDAGEFVPDDYFDALSLAIEGPSSAPPLPYIEQILTLPRSFSELTRLVAKVPKCNLDRDLIKLLARVMAQDAVTRKSITDTALDGGIDRRVRAEFRALIIAAGNDAGRRALLDIVIEDGANASGIEVDSLLAGLGFDASAALLKPHWFSLTGHHRSVALDSILTKASTQNERERVQELRAKYT